MNPHTRVLVTGADQHQGLAVIRGLGFNGLSVVACGSEPKSIGFYSRYAAERFVYTSPFESKEHFIDDMVVILKKANAGLIIPSVESTLVVLEEYRSEIERYAVLAAPPAAILDYAIDKSKTVQLARRLKVPVPPTVQGRTLAELLEQASGLRFPVAVKPRGNALYASTAHHMPFKSRYARDLEELRRLLEPVAVHSDCLLVQQCVRGIGMCVSTVFDRGEPLVMFPYVRLRELPLSGGVSVVRQSVALADTPKHYVTALLKDIKWHGVAMVEFKYDSPQDSYTLMEINPRFQASAALSLDAGLNLPYLVACLYGHGVVPVVHDYRVGIRERWLLGDVLALCSHLAGFSAEPTRTNPLYTLPSKGRLIWDFLRDFRPGTNYDVFKIYDWKPAVAEWSAAMPKAVREIKRRITKRGVYGVAP